MPSSLVTRMRGRVVQSSSGRPTRLSDRLLPREPATGSPRSLSRSRRSARARSRVISGRSGRPSGASSVTRPPRRVPRPRRVGRPRRAQGIAPATGPLRAPPGARRPVMDLVHVLVHARDRLLRPADRPALASLHAPGGAVRNRAALARPLEPVEEERRQHRRDRDPEDGARDAGDLHPDDDRPEHDDRVDAHGAGHQPRLEDVHGHEPADAHHGEHEQRRRELQVSSATATGGSHDTNGPKNGMAWSTPAATVVTPP